MRLGIDFGTTRTVVACCDRGNYPVVGFLDENRDPVDWFPSVAAEHEGELRFGFAAEAMAGEPGWTILRSFKRLLSGSQASVHRTVELGGTRLPVVELVARFLAALGDALRERSNLPAALPGDQRMQVVIATPANAHSTQRFLTLDAFRRAGFEVLAMLNEPSAAGFEYTHRYRNTLSSKREHIVVYDLGGGTFDASLVRISGRHHEAVTTAGVNELGGDDFDALLVDLALDAAGVSRAAVPARALARLTDRCRVIKEALNPSSRRVVVDLEELGGEVKIAAADYFQACTPLVERTIETMRPVMQRLDRDLGSDPGPANDNDGAALGEIAGIYVVGGASALPAVARALREKFGRRVHRSPYPFAAIAIGLAISSDDAAGFELADRFSRNFGVFREARGGDEIAFDLLVGRDAALPAAAGDQPLALKRRYRAAHNVGHFRFVECGVVDEGGVPRGDLTPFGEVLFPFDPRLRGAAGAVDLGRVSVERLGDGPLIEEEYSIDAYGIVAVRITDLGSGYRQDFRLNAAVSG